VTRAVLSHPRAETMRPDIPVIERPVIDRPVIDRRRPTLQDPFVFRSSVGLAGLPTIVAIGPFDDRTHAEQLAAAFVTVRLRCKAQLVLLGTGGMHCATVIRRASAADEGTNVYVVADCSEHRWSDVVAAADVVVPSPTTEPGTLLDVLAVGRPLVASANAATVRLVVPSSAGLVYRPGAASGMTDALLRLLTSPALRSGMATRAMEVARRHQLQRIITKQSDEGNEYD
jgi:glycosyltransferase involved in cell wall biosynthesis